MEEAKRGVFDLILIHAPSLAKIVKNISFIVEHFNGAFLCNIFKPDDTIRDSRRSEDSDPAYLARVVSMRSAASFGINTFNIDNTKRVSRHNTTLIK